MILVVFPILLYLVFSSLNLLTNGKYNQRLLIVTIIINSCINSLWIILTVKTASIAIIPTRIIKNLIMIPIMFVTTFTLGKLLKTQINEVKNA